LDNIGPEFVEGSEIILDRLVQKGPILFLMALS